MLKKLKHFTLQLIAGANIATILLMLAVGYSDHLSPLAFPTLSTAGLAFPAVLAVNVAFLLFWLLAKPLYALIPVGGLLLAYQPVHHYFPINIPHSAGTDSTLVVLTFNAHNQEALPTADFRQQVADYLIEQDADIICLQEFQVTEGIAEKLSERYTYIDSVRVVKGGDALTLISKYPILSKQHLYTKDAESQQLESHSAAFMVDLGSDTVLVVNSHLESTRLTEEERSNFKRIVKGDLERNVAEQESRKLIDRLAESTRLRAPQVDVLDDYLDTISGRHPLLLCGDFNDGPISYAHYVVASHLTDCFAESGFGAGISYHANAFYVRIDHVFCSDHWQPLSTKVDKNMTISDHYPLVCRLKRPLNP